MGVDERNGVPPRQVQPDEEGIRRRERNRDARRKAKEARSQTEGFVKAGAQVSRETLESPSFSADQPRQCDRLQTNNDLILGGSARLQR